MNIKQTVQRRHAASAAAGNIFHSAGPFHSSLRMNSNPRAPPRLPANAIIEISQTVTSCRLVHFHFFDESDSFQMPFTPPAACCCRAIATRRSYQCFA
jgi:hypothetical protein